MGITKGLWQDVEPVTAKVLASRFPAMDSRKDGKPAALAQALGKGEIVLMPGPMGVVYAETHASTIRQFVAKLLAPRFQPLVRVDAPPTVEVVLRRKDGKLVVHLLNETNMQVAGDFATTDFVPAVGPVRLGLGRQKPKSVRLEPEGVALAAREVGGEWVVEVPRLLQHSAVVVVI